MPSTPPPRSARLLLGLLAAATTTRCAAAERRRWHQPTAASRAAGIAGLVLGERVTPSMTQELYPGYAVRTAEAWRKKIKQRRPIPLARRAPQIIAVSLACSFVTEWGLAVPECGALGALGETSAGRLAGSAARTRAGQGLLRLAACPGRLCLGGCQLVGSTCGADRLERTAGDLERRLDERLEQLRRGAQEQRHEEAEASAARRWGRR